MWVDEVDEWFGGGTLRYCSWYIEIHICHYKNGFFRFHFFQDIPNIVYLYRYQNIKGKVTFEYFFNADINVSCIYYYIVTDYKYILFHDDIEFYFYSVMEFMIRWWWWWWWLFITVVENLRIFVMVMLRTYNNTKVEVDFKD